MRGMSSEILPVLKDGSLCGVLSEQRLLRFLEESGEGLASLETIVEPWATLPSHATGAEALRHFSVHGPSPVVILNATGTPVGVLHPSDLFARQPRMVVPPLIGGMATPFGVYLTSGVESGGAGSLALASTGALLVSMFIFSGLVASYVFQNASDSALMRFLLSAVSGTIFMVTMRLLPLAGTHAAEHMVVHALERGEPLTPAVVKRMPRVHPRCGTNLAVGATIFLTLFLWEWTPDVELRTLVAGMATLFLWRPLGSLVQQFVTTKPPSDAQVASGIRAAEELLNKYQYSRRNTSHPLERILRSGMLHVILGSTLTATLLHYVGLWLRIPLP